jgi:hypothetical protein
LHLCLPFINTVYTIWKKRADKTNNNFASEIYLNRRKVL